MFGRTRSIITLLLKDLANIRRKFNVVMKITMLGMCGYNFVNNLIILIKALPTFTFSNDWYLLLRPIIYLIMLALSIYWISYSISFNKSKKDKASKNKRNKTGDLIKYIKMGFRTILLSYTIIDYIINGGNILSLILWISSLITFLIQIILSIITKWVEGYIKLFSVAIEEDIKPMTNFIEKVNSTKEAITNPLYSISKAIAKKTEQDEVSPEVDDDKKKTIDYVNELNDARVKNAKDKKEKAKEEFKEFRKKVINNLGENIKKLRKIKKNKKEDNK